MRNSFFSLIISDKMKKRDRERERKKMKNSSLGGGTKNIQERFWLRERRFLPTSLRFEIRGHGPMALIGMRLQS